MSTNNTSTPEFFDDSYTYDPNAYVDQGAVSLPTPGNYRIAVTSLGRRKDRETGAVVMVDGKWPTLVVNRIKVVEPAEAAGDYSPFQEIFTKPFHRRAHAGATAWAANQIDMLRSIDVDAPAGLNMEEAIEELEKQLTSGQTLTVGVGYWGQDNDWAKAEIARNGGDACPKEKRSEIWKAAKLTTKDFKNADGTYRTKAMGKSGKLIEAKLKLSTFVPSNKDVELGPYKR